MSTAWLLFEPHERDSQALAYRFFQFREIFM